MNTTHIFPAVLFDEGNYLVVDFPDLAIHTFGGDLREALEMAKDALCLTLYDMEEQEMEIPQPSDIRDLRCKEGAFTTLVKCDTMEYRKYFHGQSVEKPVTLPAWLCELAEREEVSLSIVLQEALKHKLHLI